MNVNSTNNSNSFSPCKVVSKFFASSPVMDESLSEFKEKKGACKGPKNSQKPTVNKAKPKKLPKRIKGQKDIRTALKSKNNEQLTYAKEFDEVCKKGGIDIDSEQLQLAIALSKSLQSSGESESNSSQKPLNSQERTKKIRTTLQEYGFAVPERKVTKKRLKNQRKNYKLLLSTDTEKQQIVSDRYAQVLFTNASPSKCIDNQNVDYSSNRCYYVATGITYMTLQNNSTFYVEDLVEKSTSKGSLLRDWASIPGRPVSPVIRDTVKMNISEIECSQEKLDIVLSGTLKSAKDVVKKQVDSILSMTPTIVIDIESNLNPEESKEDGDKTLVNEESVRSVNMDVSKNKTLSVSDRIRSCSPDIFDDEESLVLDSNNDTSDPKSETTTVDVVMDLTNDVHLKQKNNQPNGNKNNFVMDLTQAESNEGDYSTDLSKQNVTKKCSKPISQCSQGSDYTRRDSNDSMEITECVGISPKNNSIAGDSIRNISPGSNKARRYSEELMEVIECVAMSCSQVNSNEEHLQTTISQIVNKTKRKSNDLMEMTECVASTSHHIPHNIENNIDLTQNSDESNIVDGIVDNISEKVDLTQSSNSVDELPIVQMSENDNSLDDTIILNNDEICINNPTKLSAVMSEPCLITSEHTLDLTNTTRSPLKVDDNVRNSNKSHFDEFFYNHSDETSKETLEKSVQSQTDDLEPEESHDNDEVDLTQSSDSSVASKEQQSNSCSIQTSKSSLGKKGDDMSIDYDEMYDLIANNDTDASTKKDYSRSSIDYDLTEENGKTTGSENISQSSQVFDLSDKELEYSLNASRHDAAWAAEFGGISVIDRDLSVRKSGINIEQKGDTPNHTINKTMSESLLPMVKVKSNIQKPTTAEDKFKTPVTLFKEKAAVTPSKAFAIDSATLDTPTSNEYIVKTDQVTPILDYASMSTPERNRELDKYGLKPFKKKRAIQLLTHLYNQTHPVVESCQEDLPSPSKKRKPSQPSPKKITLPGDHKKEASPRKLIKSPVTKSQPIEKAKDANKENDVYEMTTELPEIKAIECSEEDWVFQKREKAKIHSCRVPLHIALQNYISCRRRLQEAILRYEPVNIDVIHKELAASGHRYDPKDLLKFLDKKCITVKTADNNARNNKR